MVNFETDSECFSRVTEELILLVEFLFNEVIPILTSPDAKYSPEEVEALASNFFTKMVEWLQKFLDTNANNNKILNEKLKVVDIEDFMDYDFETHSATFHWRVDKPTLNAVILLKFIGNLIAKQEMAIFFIEKNPESGDNGVIASGVLTLVKQFLKGLKAEYSYLFVNAMEIVQSQNRYIDFLRMVRTFEAQKVGYKGVEQTSLFEIELRGSLPFRGYTSFLALYLLQKNVIKDVSYFHLMEPWHVVKQILNLICFLEIDFFQSTPFFSQLFKFLLNFIKEKKLKILSNTNLGNLALDDLLKNLKHMAWNQHSFTEQVSKQIAEIFNELYSKIDSPLTRYNTLKRCIEPYQNLTLEHFNDVGEEILKILCSEVAKALASGDQNSHFFKMGIFKSTLKMLKSCRKERLVILADGIVELVKIGALVIKEVQESEEKEPGKRWLAGEKFGDLRLGGVKEVFEDNKDVFEGIVGHFRVKRKDVGEELASDELTNVKENGKGLTNFLAKEEEERLRNRAKLMRELEFFENVQDIETLTSLL